MATSRLASAPAWTELGTLGGPGGWGATDICWGPLGGGGHTTGAVRGGRRHLGMATPRELMLSVGRMGQVKSYQGDFAKFMIFADKHPFTQG